MQQQLLINNAYDTYKRQDILTASPMDLIIMLYDALKKNLLQAEISLKKGNIQTSHNKLVRSQDIIEELVNSLNMEFEISQELANIYDFMLHQLAEINVSKNPEPITALVEIVDDLRGAWQEVAKQTKGSIALEG